MKEIRKEEARRVLVRAPNWLGDAVMCLPAIRALHRALKPDELRVLAVSSLGDLFARYPFISDVLHFTKKNAHTAHSLLASEHYDAFFLFTNSFGSALDASKTGCPIRVGYGGNLRGPLLTYAVEATGGIHMVDYYLNLLSPFWGTLFSQEIDFPLLPSEEEFAGSLSGLDGAVAIPLGARYGQAKCWPHHNLKSLVKMLTTGPKRRVVLFGAEPEKLQAEALMGISPNLVVNLVGKTSIGQMAAVMGRCEWVVANDSGPLHVAGAVGVKTVALFGPTDYRRTAPLSGNIQIISREADCAPCMKRECPIDHHCMNKIKAEEIYDIICQHAEP